MSRMSDKEDSDPEDKLMRRESREIEKLMNDLLKDAERGSNRNNQGDAHSRRVLRHFAEERELDHLTTIALTFEKHLEVLLCRCVDPFYVRAYSSQNTIQSIYRQITYPHKELSALNTVQKEKFMKFLGQRLTFRNASVALKAAILRILMSASPLVPQRMYDSELLYYEEKYLKLYAKWIREGEEPLKSYALAVLTHSCIVSCAVQEQVALIPDVIKWLKRLKDRGDYVEVSKQQPQIRKTKKKRRGGSNTTSTATSDTSTDTTSTTTTDAATPTAMTTTNAAATDDSTANDSVYSRYIPGCYSIHPLSDVFRQITLLQYLQHINQVTKIERPDVYILNGMDLMDIVLHYVDIRATKNIMLTREGLKFARQEFVNIPSYPSRFVMAGGLQILMHLPLQTMATRYLLELLRVIVDCEKAILQIIHLPKEVITEFISYCMQLLPTSRTARKIGDILCRLMQFMDLMKIFGQLYGLDFLLNMLEAKGPQREVPVMKPRKQKMTMEIIRLSTSLRSFMPVMESYYQSHAIMKAAELMGKTFTQPKMLREDEFMDSVHYLAATRISSKDWKIVDTLLQGSYMQHLFSMIAEPREKTHVPFDCACSVLLVVGTTPEGQLRICEAYESVEGVKSLGFRMLLNIMVTTYSPIVKVMCLRVIHQCLCYTAHLEKFPQLKSKGEDDILLQYHMEKIRDTVHMSGAINVLLEVVGTQTPYYLADELRSLAVQCLHALAAKPEIAQILGKIPMITNGQLEEMKRMPVMRQKTNEHQLFCKYANELMERVTVKERIKTEIKYPDKELLQLIYSHLLAKGLTTTAKILRSESESVTPVDNKESMFIPVGSERSQPLFTKSSSVNTDTPQPGTSTAQRHNLPVIRKLVVRKPQPQKTLTSVTCYPLDLSSLRKQLDQISMTTPPSLDSIVTQQLRNQHMKCCNPVAVCPTFQLRGIHSCPEFSKQVQHSTAVTNATHRTAMYQVDGAKNSILSQRRDRSLKYNRFFPLKTYENRGAGLLSCIYLKHPMYTNNLVGGDVGGQLRFFDSFSEESIHSTSWESSNRIVKIQQSKSGRLVTTSNPYGTKLWTLGKKFKMKYNKEFKVQGVSLSNSSDDKIAGYGRDGLNDAAQIFSTETGQKLVKLFDVRHQMLDYDFTMFNSDDKMLLCNGVLWDIRSAELIHQFEQFEKCVYTGLIHPTELQFVINNRVWDARTFKLLEVIPDLEHCGYLMQFSNDGKTLISATSSHSEHNKSFVRTFDATTYKTIGTMDTGMKIVDLSIDFDDRRLAMIAADPDRFCRVYDIGRKRITDDEPKTKEEETAIDQETRRVVLEEQIYERIEFNVDDDLESPKGLLCPNDILGTDEKTEPDFGKANVLVALLQPFK